MRILMFTAILTASAALAQDPAGRYRLEGVREVGSELVLKSDKTFEYYLAYGAADYHAKGTWSQQAGDVILNSQTTGAPPFRVLASEAKKQPAVRVWVKGPKGHPAANIDVVLETAKGPLEARTDSDGVALFPEGQPKSVKFQIPVYQFESDPIPVNAAHNDFHFEINGEAITEVKFKGERLKMLDAKTLEMHHWNPDRPIQYRK